MSRRLDDRPALLACDWNGTLVADAGRALAATNDVLRALALREMDDAAFRATFSLPLAAFFANLGVPPALLVRAKVVWNRRLAARPAQPAPGLHRLLAAADAARIPVGVVSAANEDVVRADAALLGLTGRLAFVEGGADDKEAVLRRLVAAATGPVLYLGDTEYDVRAALAAGATPVGVANGYRPATALREAGAALVVADLVDMATLLADAAAPRAIIPAPAAPDARPARRPSPGTG